MFGFMGMLVLILEPRVLPEISKGLHPETGIEELESVARRAKNQAANIRGEPAVRIVEPHDDEAAFLETSEDRSECERRITRVMQEAVGADKVKALGPEYRSKEVHLNEADTRNT